MNMKLGWIVPLLCVLLASGCSYRGQVRKNIYQRQAVAPKISASVLIPTDTNIPQELFFTDPDDSDFQSFRLETKDGVLFAVSDALGSLFSTVERGRLTEQENYDFVAQVTLESGLTRGTCAGELSKWAVRQEGLCTLVTVTLYRPDTTQVAGAKAVRWRAFRTPGLASSVRWFNKHTFIFSPLLTPIYMQTQGSALRKQFEENLTEILEDITTQLAQQRALFEDSAQNKMTKTAQNYVE